jgi:hypothetical protein
MMAIPAPQVEHNVPAVDLIPHPMLTLVHDADNYDAIERTAPGVASRGVHPVRKLRWSAYMRRCSSASGPSSPVTPKPRLSWQW